MSKMTWLADRGSRARTVTRRTRGGAVPAPCDGAAPCGRTSNARPPRHRVLPIGEQRAQRRDERERLVEDQMMIRLRDLDDRGVAVEQLVHVLAGLGWDEVAEFRA